VLDALLEMFFELFGEAISELFCWVVTKALVGSYEYLRVVLNEVFK